MIASLQPAQEAAAEEKIRQQKNGDPNFSFLMPGGAGAACYELKKEEVRKGAASAALGVAPHKPVAGEPADPKDVEEGEVRPAASLTVKPRRAETRAISPRGIMAAYSMGLSRYAGCSPLRERAAR